MKKYIVTTTIYKPSKAIKKYISFKDWFIIIVGDLKTPHDSYLNLEKENQNVLYLSPNMQEQKYKKLSDLIGWNKIQRRSIGFLEAYILGADIVASVDDDNIPYDNWGKNILVGKEIDVHYYETDNIAFDPIGVTNYKNLWHRGYPIQDLTKRNNFKISIKKIIPDIQACFWNGDPDIDALCRIEHGPMCFFDDKYFPLSSNAFSPFNHQNTIVSRKVLKYWLAIPYIGRMDDIWPSYYIEAHGFKVIYDRATVYQDRNIQNLTKNLKDEFLGYENTKKLLYDLKKNPNNLIKYLPEESKNVLELYQSYFYTKKVAVCITGRLNLLPYTYKTINKNVIDQLGNDVDIYIYGSTNIIKKGTCKSNEDNLNHINEEFISKYLNYKKLCLESDIDLSSKNKDLLIKEWGSGKEKYLQMLYALMKCNKMIKDSNIEYDFVVRLRVDVIFPIKIPHISEFKLNAITMPDFHNERGGKIPTNKKEFYINNKLISNIDGRTIHDRFAIGPPNLMNILLDQYKLLPRNQDFYNYINCEHLLNNYLRWNNLSWENKNIIRDKNIIFFRVKLDKDNKILFDKTDIKQSRHKNDYQYAPDISPFIDPNKFSLENYI